MRITRDIVNRLRRRWPDVLIACLLFAAATAVGSLYYRSYLELADRQRTPMRPPAVQIDVPVMFACGQGFMRPTQRIEPLMDFVRMRAPGFSCDDLPADLRLREPVPMARKHLYLLSSIAWTWIAVGSVSWAGLFPLFGIFYGCVITLAYGLLRLGMGRLLASLGSLALIVSPLHLAHQFNLRDYSKAPFILAILLIMGWLATRAPSRAATLCLSAGAGALLGFGFGFRADMPIVIPAFVTTLFCFLPGRILGRLRLKAAALILFLGCFVLAGWPMIQKRVSSHRLYHAALVGLTEDRLEGMGVSSPLYSLGGDGAQKDRFITTTVNADARRTYGADPPPYKRTSAEFYREIARNFPADMLVLAYASTLKVLELPFMNPVDYASLPNTGVFLPNQPFPPGIDSGSIRGFYRAWVGALATLQGAGLPLAVAAVLFIAVRDLRRAAFLLFCILYFGGYPAIQFETRHFFHLELISLWTLGFVVERLFRLIRSLAARARQGELPELPRRSEMLRLLSRRLLAPILAIAVVVLGPLLILRAVQTWHLREVLEAYAGAELEPLELTAVPENSDTVRIESPRLKSLLEAGEPLGVEYAVADFSPKSCDFSCVDLVVRYSEPVEFIKTRGPFRFGLPLWDLSHTLRVEVPGTSDQGSRVVFPVYQAPSQGADFGGLELPRAQAGCLSALSRVKDLASLSLPVGFIVRLPPDWRKRPRYKLLSEWEAAHPGGERVYTAPPGIVVADSEFESKLARLPASRPALRAASVRLDGDAWTIRGRAEARFSPLAQIDEIDLDQGSRVVIKGEVRRGGLVLGLTRKERWDGSQLVVAKDAWATLGFYEKHQRILELVRSDDWNEIETIVFAQTESLPEKELYDRWAVIQVARRGRFIAVFEVSAAARYSLVLANAVGLPGARNDAVIEEIGRMASKTGQSPM